MGVQRPNIRMVEVDEAYCEPGAVFANMGRRVFGAL